MRAYYGVAWRYHAAILLLILTPPVVLAATPAGGCSREWVCVEFEQAAGRVEVFASNLKPYPVTLSLSLRGTALPAAVRRTVTQTVPGRERVLLRRFDEPPRGGYSYSWDWTVGSLDVAHDDTHAYRFPYAAGRSYRVLQGYGSRFSHTGLERYTVDFDMPVGTPVHAARAGVVAMLEESNELGCWEDWCSRHANYLLILHDDGSTGEYYHLDKDGVLVEQGARVERGQLVARSGNTGHTTMPHLHFGVYEAADWGRTRSLPVGFESATGVIRKPRAGARYEAVE